MRIHVDPGSGSETLPHCQRNIQLNVVKIFLIPQCLNYRPRCLTFLYTPGQCTGSESGSAWIRMFLTTWIRIRIRIFFMQIRNTGYKCQIMRLIALNLNQSINQNNVISFSKDCQIFDLIQFSCEIVAKIKNKLC